MERALELLDVSGGVRVSGKAGLLVFEQIICAGGEGYLPVHRGLYRFDGSSGSVVQLEEFRLAVEAGRVEEELPVFDGGGEVRLKYQITHPVV